MVKNVAIKKSKIHEKGVFASRDFKKGDLILEIDDSNIVTDPAKLTKKQHDYLDYLENGKIVLMKAPERYINHSCDPNTYIKTVDGVRKVFAMRDIWKGDEITFDYSINGYGYGTWECHCRSKNCRRSCQIDFFKLPKSLQIKYLPYLDDWFKEEFKDRIDELRRDK